MKSRFRATVLSFLLLPALAPAAAVARQAAQPAAAPATIRGRVAEDGGEGVRGVGVLLLSSEPAARFKALARTTTDPEGRYVLADVPPGRYQIMPLAGVYVVAGLADAFPPGKPVIVAAGESVEDFDFTLTRGGVITGRVTDADGRPLVREIVHLSALDANRPRVGGLVDPYRYQTDDRGVYRLYGLPAGRYRVSAGRDRESGNGRPGPNGFYQRVYYPGTTREAEAAVVEVKAGGEVADIDITLGRPAKTYRVSGRVVNAESGRPAAGVRLGYGAVRGGEGRVVWSGTAQTDARGEFHLSPFAPGRYVVFAAPEGAGDWYGDSAPFEVGDSDVSGLEVRLRRGASLTGAVRIEGTGDRATLARLMSQIFIAVNYERRGEPPTPDYSRTARPAADGSFHVGGLRPGRVRLVTGWPPVKGLTLLRVEHEGADRSDGIEVGEGAQLTGVRAVFAYGDAAVRGQVNVVGGALPPQSRLVAFVLRPGGSGHFLGRPADVDARGRFAVEGLPAGDYELVVRAFGPDLRPREIRQHVTLAEDGETNVTLTLDLAAENDGRKP